MGELVTKRDVLQVVSGKLVGAFVHKPTGYLDAVKRTVRTVRGKLLIANLLIARVSQGT